MSKVYWDTFIQQIYQTGIENLQGILNNHKQGGVRYSKEFCLSVQKETRELLNEPDYVLKHLYNLSTQEDPLAVDNRCSNEVKTNIDELNQVNISDL